MKKEIVIGLYYDDIKKDSLSAKLVYSKVTTGGVTSRESSIGWAYKNGANSVHVYPDIMVDHLPFMTEEDVKKIKKDLDTEQEG